MKKLEWEQDYLQLNGLSYKQPGSPICGIVSGNLIRESEKGIRERYAFLLVLYMGCLVPTREERGREENIIRDFYAIFFLGIHHGDLWVEIIFSKCTGENDHCFISWISLMGKTRRR